MPGHIKMGAPGALRDYMLADTDLYSKSPANQFAAKLATGAGNYDDLQNWSYWVQDDWQLGVGQKDTEAGGFLYSEVESRFPNRLALSAALEMVVTESDGPTNYGHQAGKDLQPNGSITIGTTQSVKRIAQAVKAPAAGADDITVGLWLNNVETSITVAIYSSTTSGGNQIPNALVTAQNITPSAKPGQSLHLLAFTATLTGAAIYHIVVYPKTAGETITVPLHTTGWTNASTYNGTVWSNYTSGAMLYGVHFNPTNSVNHIVYFPATGFLYAALDTLLLKKENDSDGWEVVDTMAATITDLQIVGDELWVGQGNSSNYQVMDSSDTVSAAAVPGRLFTTANGYAWRAVSENVYYTADGTTWTGPIAVAQSGHQVRGMAHLGDYIYVSTDEGFYYIGYGDFVFEVTKWSLWDGTAATEMINYNGSLFIPVGHSLFRFDGNSMLPVGLDKGEGLPQNRIGRVLGLYPMNNWLIAVLPTTVWAYNDQGWHHLANLGEVAPLVGGIAQSGFRFTGGITYDGWHLFLGAMSGTVLRLTLLDSANFKSISYPIYRSPNGFIETDWFFGGLREVNKDFESVYISGENLSSSLYVRVYWKDDSSTDWELLGTVTSDRTELRWSDYSTRPNSKQLKLGLLLVSTSTDEEATPIIRVVRIKYHPMVSDWFRWSFPILVSDRQQEMGGGLSAYSAAQKRIHLDALTTQVPPFILEDMGGTQYEVKVMGCQIQNMKVEWKNGEMIFDSIYNMTVEQIRSGTYD